jgi:hypothetical protein
MYADFGNGTQCIGCDTPIGPSSVEYDFVAADGREFSFHLGCAALWEAEPRRRGLLV